MNAWSILAAVALLWATATGIGMLLVRPLPPGAAPAGATPRALSSCSVAGLCTLAATLPSLFVLGVPRGVLLGLAYATSLAGWFGNGAAVLRELDRRSVLTLVVALGCCGSPAVVAMTTVLMDYDALMIWWPKVKEVSDGTFPYIGAATDTHVNPAYPRGMAWLSSVANPLGPPSIQVMRMVAWLWVCTTALLIFAASRPWMRWIEAMSLAVVFLLLPEVVHQAATGLSDTPIAAAALLAAIGLGERPSVRGYALSSIGGIGAAAIKTEGVVVLLVVMAHFAFDLLRRPECRRRALVAIAAAGVLLPVLLRASGEPQTRMEVLPFLVRNPDVVLARTIAVLEGVLRFQFAPSTFAGADGSGPVALTCWTGWVVATLLLLLLVCGRRRVVALSPAVMLLPAAFAVYVTTGISTKWHIATTLPRLVVEVLPTCLLAAGISVFGRSVPRSGAPMP